MSAAAPPPRRWAVLAVYMVLTLATQVQWVALAPVARAAERFYAGQLGAVLNVDALALAYLLVYLVACVPASYVIDTHGIRFGLGVGAALSAAGGLVKAAFAQRFLAVLGGQVLLAVAQPFVINAAPPRRSRR